MLRIFVSYTTFEDHLNKERLNDVHNDIEQLDVIKQLDNIYIYIHLLHNNVKDPQEKVEKELSLSSIVIFLETPNASKSSWFKKEKELASEHGKKRIKISIPHIVNWNNAREHIKAILEKKITAKMIDHQHSFSDVS